MVYHMDHKMTMSGFLCEVKFIYEESGDKMTHDQYDVCWR